MKTSSVPNLAALVLVVALAPSANAAIAYATNATGSLLRFDTSTPGSAASVGITGLQAGESLLGIDFRPASGALFGLGTTGRLYTLDLASGGATQVGAPGAFTAVGSSFGFDFNPVPDRIRLTSDADQNLRLNPNNAGLAGTDTPLAFAAADANAGQNPNIVGSAYTNSFPGTATTTLYGIDYVLGILVTQVPPNAGTLNTVGSLGVATTANVGFDIFFPGNLGFASLQSSNGFSSLYSINLSTGSASLLGAIGDDEVITGFAVQPIPEPGTAALAAIGIAIAVAVRRRLAV